MRQDVCGPLRRRDDVGDRSDSPRVTRTGCAKGGMNAPRADRGRFNVRPTNTLRWSRPSRLATTANGKPASCGLSHGCQSGKNQGRNGACAVFCNRINDLKQRVAPRAGFEPATNRLTAGCSTTELPGNRGARASGAAYSKHLSPLQRSNRHFFRQSSCRLLENRCALHHMLRYQAAAGGFGTR